MLLLITYTSGQQVVALIIKKLARLSTFIVMGAERKSSVWPSNQPTTSSPVLPFSNFSFFGPFLKASQSQVKPKLKLKLDQQNVSQWSSIVYWSHLVPFMLLCQSRPTVVAVVAESTCWLLFLSLSLSSSSSIFVFFFLGYQSLFLYNYTVTIFSINSRLVSHSTLTNNTRYPAVPVLQGNPWKIAPILMATNPDPDSSTTKYKSTSDRLAKKRACIDWQLFSCFTPTLVESQEPTSVYSELC